MNNTRYSSNVTRAVNRGIQLGSRPLGKGSRATSYNNIIRTNNDQLMSHVSHIRFKLKRTSHCHGQDKWMIEDNAASHAHNLDHILYFSELLHRKQGSSPALPTLVEFIVFLIRHPNSIEAIGSFQPIKKTSPPPPPPPPPSPSPPSTSLHSPPAWSDDFHSPNFDDEEDLM